MSNSYVYIVKITTTRTATIFLDKNDILHIKMHDNVRIDHDDTVDNLLVVKSYTKGRKVLKLIDARAKCSVDRKAKELINRIDEKQTIARAVIKSSFITKVLLTFFTELNKPEIPTKIFTDKDEAYNWLLIMGIKAKD